MAYQVPYMRAAELQDNAQRAWQSDSPKFKDMSGCDFPETGQ